MNRKELLTENRKAFRFLHEKMCFDFEKPCVVIKGAGRFTYNGVKKEIERHISGGYSAAVLIRRNNPHFNRGLYFVTVGASRFGIDKGSYSHGIDDFWGVGQFEDVRKNETAHYYIIAQSWDYLTEPKQDKPRDTAARYKYIPYDHEKHGDGRGNTYIGELRLMWRDGSGEVFTYKPYEGYFTRDERKEKTVWDIVDKSGYMVLERRRELRRRALKLRLERRKAAAAAADFTAQEKAVEKKFEAVRAEIAAVVMQCNTYEDAKRINNAAGLLSRAFSGWAYHKERRSAGKYAAPENIESALQDIAERLCEASAALVQ